MDDNFKNAASYQLDQEILDARGINMTVEDVAGLSTVKYSERVSSLQLSLEDLAFLKGLRRRIKNRMASQNSRRRNVEHLRRLTRELRAVRARRDGADEQRRLLLRQRAQARHACGMLREHLVKVLQQRSDPTSVPSIDIEIDRVPTPVEMPDTEMKVATEKKMKTIEYRIEKIVNDSVHHIFKSDKKIYAKTVFLDCTSDVKNIKLEDEGSLKSIINGNEVLNLSVKERRKSHGRKQLAPRRIAYACGDINDGVLDLKIKKESQ